MEVTEEATGTAAPAGALYWQRIAPLMDRYGALPDPEEFRSAMADVPAADIGVFAAHVCLSEVHNGGLLAVFWNSTGVLAPEALFALRAMGMTECAAVFEAGMRLLGPEAYPLIREERWDALLRVSGQSSRNLERIFNSTPDLYLAFTQATEPLGLGAYDLELWRLMREENGGFSNAADRFFESNGTVEPVTIASA